MQREEKRERPVTKRNQAIRNDKKAQMQEFLDYYLPGPGSLKDKRFKACAAADLNPGTVQEWYRKGREIYNKQKEAKDPKQHDYVWFYRQVLIKTEADEARLRKVRFNAAINDRNVTVAKELEQEIERGSINPVTQININKTETIEHTQKLLVGIDPDTLNKMMLEAGMREGRLQVVDGKVLEINNGVTENRQKQIDLRPTESSEVKATS